MTYTRDDEQNDNSGREWPAPSAVEPAPGAVSSEDDGRAFAREIIEREADRFDSMAEMYPRQAEGYRAKAAGFRDFLRCDALASHTPEQPDSRSGAGGIPQQLPMPPYRFQDEGGPSISGGSTFAPAQPQQPDTLAEGFPYYAVLADLHTIKGWLHGLSTCPDLNDVVADGGVSTGDCYQQEALEFAGRLGRAIQSLTPHAPATRLLAERDREIEGLRAGCAKQNDEVCQVLGKALGYPWFKDDQKNFPDATEADGVCVGEHVAESIADEAAARIVAAEADAAKLREALERIAQPEYGIGFRKLRGIARQALQMKGRP